MARKRTKLIISASALAQLKQRLRSTADLREKERMQVVLWATRGQHTLDELAALAGRARSTIQIWLDDYDDGGLAQLVRRDAPPGKSSLVASAKVQKQLREGLQEGRWRTAAQVAAWLEQTHGIQRAVKSIY